LTAKGRFCCKTPSDLRRDLAPFIFRNGALLVFAAWLIEAAAVSTLKRY
jgi:hypothetical protein